MELGKTYGIPKLDWGCIMQATKGSKCPLAQLMQALVMESKRTNHSFADVANEIGRQATHSETVKLPSLPWDPTIPPKNPRGQCLSILWYSMFLFGLLMNPSQPTLPELKKARARLAESPEPPPVQKPHIGIQKSEGILGEPRDDVGMIVARAGKGEFTGAEDVRQL
jgi:hypothetical protein